MTSFWKKNLVVLCFYLLLFVGVYFFIFSPSLSQLDQSKAALDDVNSQFNSSLSKLSSLEKISSNQDNFSDIEETVSGYLPTTLDSGKFIVQIEDLTKSLGIMVDNISMNQAAALPQTGSKKKVTYSATQFSLTASTTFTQFTQLLKSLETLPRYNTLTSLDINSAGADKVSIKLSGNIYYGQ